MPVIEIKMWPRTKEQKAEIIEKIRKIFTDMGVPKEQIVIILNELPKENWG